MALKTGTIWHFSDLHLRAGWDRGDAVERDRVDGLPTNEFTIDAQAALFNFIQAKRNEAAGRQDSRIATVLVISGDLVHQSGWKEAASVRRFIERLRTALDLPPDRVLIIPGNHDVNLRTAVRHADLSRSEYAEATQGYRTATQHCQEIAFPEDGLAFLLTDTVSSVGVPVNLDKVIGAVQRAFPDLDGTALKTVVAEAVSTEVPTIATEPVKQALQRLASLSAPAPSVSGTMSTDPDLVRLPRELLGLLISHYPLLPCPWTNVEIKQFHLPVGAGQVKRLLSDAGVHVCLHGHQHVSWMHTEKTVSGSPDMRFACIGAGSLTQDDKSFNLIKYALMTETGEARIAVRPISLRPNRVQQDDARRLHIPPRVGHPARTIRLVERIHADGHVRGDKWFSDVATLGWQVDSRSGKRSKSIPIVIQTDQAGPPLTIHVSELTPGFSARLDPHAQVEQLAGHQGAIRLEVDDNVERISFAYREYNRFAYCATVEQKARSFGGELAVSDMRFNEEALVHVVRVPCERLEVYVRTPGRAPGRDELRLITFIESPDGSLVAEPSLAVMSDCTIESWPEAKRLRLTVPRPMEGAAYGIAWRLPSVTPTITGPDKAKAVKLHRRLERLRGRLLRARDVTSEREQLEDRGWKAFERAVREKVRQLCSEAQDSAEIALFVPDQPLLTLDEYRKQQEAGTHRPEVQLRPCLASFGPGYDRWNCAITVGLGVAGLAYLMNRIVHFDSNRMTQTPAVHDSSPPSPYMELTVNGKTLPSHTSLYAYPLFHPDAPHLPLGCVCVGSLERDPDVYLGEEDFRDELRTLLTTLIA